MLHSITLHFPYSLFYGCTELLNWTVFGIIETLSPSIQTITLKISDGLERMPEDSPRSSSLNWEQLNTTLKVMGGVGCIQFDISTNSEELIAEWKDFVNEALPGAATRGLSVEVIQTEYVSSPDIFIVSTKLTPLDLQ